MRSVSWTLCVLALGLQSAGAEPALAPPGATAPPAVVSGADAYVAFPGAGLQLVKPQGFEKAESFHGFGWAEKQASVMATRIPGPFDKITEGFTVEQLKPRGIDLQSKEPIRIEGQDGLLLKVAQSAGGSEFLKWLVVFGDAKQTFLVTATFPEEHAAELSDRLKASVLATRLYTGPAVDPGADRNFSLVGSKKLVLTPGLGKELVYTKDGVLPAKHPDDPLFIAAPALGKVTILDSKEYARARMRSVGNTRVSKFVSHVPVRIAGASGFESVAEAVHTTTKSPLTVYQVMLFREGAYFLMQGLVRTREAKTYLPEFKAMARSLKFKK